MRAGLLAAPVDGTADGTAAGLTEALSAVDAFDQALSGGLLRSHQAQSAGLAALARAVAGTPLAARVAEAAGKARAGAAGEDHFVALAGARIALLGAVHDALLTLIAEATGRPVAAGAPAGSQAGSQAGPATGTAAGPAGGAPPARNLLLLAAARSWLSDLARAGWQGLDLDVVAGASPVIAALLADPELRRLATLLDGFAAELAACCPVADRGRIPVRRWADLWSRALLLTQPGAATPPAGHGTATGRLLPLGVDLQEHPTAAQAQVHAVFEPADGGQARLVRASVSAPKPDSVIGAGVWQLLRPHMSLLGAAGTGRAMELAGMPLTSAGDLIWSDRQARLAEPVSPFTTARVALPGAVGAPAAPLDRHPAVIAVPVFLERYTVRKENDMLAFTVAGQALPVDAGRRPAAAPLTRANLAASSACIGLLRWDAGEFRVQPLAVETTVKKKQVEVHAGGWAAGTTDPGGAKAEQAATDAIVALVERAGRLLRK
jgi:hypothetical protein